MVGAKATQRVMQPFVAEHLLPPDDAVAAFLARVLLGPPALERVALDEAYGRVLAEAIAADAAYPSAPRSAMDGFAVRAADTPGALRIVGAVAMGASASPSVERGEAVSIPTGGVVPASCDAVVPIEDVRVAGATVHVPERVAIGTSIHPRGCDMQRGDVVLAAGRRIDAAGVGVLATLGIARVSVFARPRVALISCGDELVPPEAAPAVGEVRDSNRYAVAAMLRALGVEVVHQPTARDETGALEAALARALVVGDAVIVSGGSSVGERDRTPGAVAALGAPGVIVHGLRIKPGKPTLLGAVGGTPVIGLPGNPTSALLVLDAVVAPILSAMIGAPVGRHTVEARLAQPLEGRPGWTGYLPVSLARHDDGTLLAHPLPLRSSSVSLLARADGYVVVAPSRPSLPAGAPIRVRRFLGS